MSLISVTLRSGQETQIHVRRHQLTSDMSEDDGGHDEGPSPSELMVGSLGACIVMMVQRYCDRHGYRDGKAAASLSYELTGNPARIGAITVDLEIPKDVPEGKRAVLKRIAEACPIHQTLGTPPMVDLEIL